MSENKEKPKRLMELFLIKMAARDKALVGKTNEKKFKSDSNLPSTSHKSNEPTAEGINSNPKNQNPLMVPPVLYTSFPQFNPSLQIQLETNFEHELKATQMFGVPSTSTTVSLLSETSVKSSVSSMKSIVKNFLKVEENNPSFYQKLVIPFSGFTESDVKEIRGGREPKSTYSRQSLPRTSGGNDPRPVLKRYQSEKRKSSYDRYVQESLENFLQARSNTDDSSYNTVIAVKMMVDNASKVEERVDHFIIDEPNENNSKDTIFIPNSERLSARLERILSSASIEVSFNEHPDEITETPSSNSIPISDANIRSKLIEMREELERLDKVYDRMHGELEEAEKAYFTAKVNFYRIKLKRDMLITQMNNLEEELTHGNG